MAGHFKLMVDNIAYARGSEAEMRLARDMYKNSKGKFFGRNDMTIEHDPVDYPYRGKDEPKIV